MVRNDYLLVVRHLIAFGRKYLYKILLNLSPVLQVTSVHFDEILQITLTTGTF